VGPTYTTIKKSHIWEDLKRACVNGWVSKSEQDKEIEFPGGGSIAVYSADNPDSLRGPGLDGVVIDEAAFMSVEAWQNGLRPALSDKNGWAIFITSPNGFNWIHKLFKDAEGRSGWSRWQLPSSQNPLVTDVELEDVKKDLGPRKFAQEHEAKFMEIEGAKWPAAYFEDLTVKDFPDAFEISSIAVDPSLGKSEQSDYSAVVFVGVTQGLVWVDVDIKRRDPGSLVEAIFQMRDRYNPTAVGIEANGFQDLFQPLINQYAVANRAAPLPIVPMLNSESKHIRIQRLDPYLAQWAIRIREGVDSDLLIEQLMFFPSKDYHDDGPDALEMAIRLINELNQAETE